jgi:5'-3' exonuclease
MGVPAFFRWLTVRYPKVVVDALNSEDLDQYEEEYRKERGDNNEI